MTQATSPNQSKIIVDGIKKYFGKIRALDDITLKVETGAITAILGPNGAGKTTLIRILTTLLMPDRGEATVGGFSIRRDAKNLRTIIGLAGQSAAVDEMLTGIENLEMAGYLYHLNRREVKRRARELLKKFGLEEAARRTAKNYSGGMRRRLDLAVSLIGDPKILFLDEPTAGLDPRSRNILWEILKKLVKDGITILLTTQYLDEADRLADKIIIIDHGTLIAEGTPRELKSRFGEDVLEINVLNPEMRSQALEALKGLEAQEPIFIEDTNLITVPVKGNTAALVEVVRKLDAAGVSIENIVIRKPTLDDVFLALTGHGAEHKRENQSHTKPQA